MVYQLALFAGLCTVTVAMHGSSSLLLGADAGEAVDSSVLVVFILSCA